MIDKIIKFIFDHELDKLVYVEEVSKVYILNNDFIFDQTEYLMFDYRLGYEDRYYIFEDPNTLLTFLKEVFLIKSK